MGIYWWYIYFQIDCSPSLPNQFEPLAMAYDWLSETLYIAGKVNENKYTILRKAMTEGEEAEAEEVFTFPRINFETIQLIVNPLTG